MIACDCYWCGLKKLIFPVAFLVPLRLWLMMIHLGNTTGGQQNRCSSNNVDIRICWWYRLYSTCWCFYNAAKLVQKQLSSSPFLAVWHRYEYLSLCSSTTQNYIYTFMWKTQSKLRPYQDTTTKLPHVHAFTLQWRYIIDFQGILRTCIIAYPV